MKDVFKTIIVDFMERELKEVKERDYHLPLNSKKIVSVIGIRRCGKTYLLFDLIKKLRKKMPKENIIYINFEDDRLFGITVSHLTYLIDGYFELYPEKRKEKIYLFLDEIEIVPGWEKFVRRVYDNFNVNIFITGSSSRLLRKEISSSLRGRTITYDIFPLSFREYLTFSNVKPENVSSKSKSLIKNLFYKYLKFGGFPELVDEEEDIKRKILSDYVDLIVYRDIIERYGIKNITLLKTIIKYSFSNPSTLISFNKLYNELKSLGYKLGKETLYDFFDYLEDAFALFTVPIFKNSVKKERRNPKKLYIADNGFKYIFNTSLSPENSKLLENMVFLHLRRKYRGIYYYRGKQEVDFFVNEGGEKKLINVCYSLNSLDTKKREIKGLLEGMEYFGLKKSYLITAEEEEKIEIEGKTIITIPFYKWSLQRLD